MDRMSNVNDCFKYFHSFGYLLYVLTIDYKEKSQQISCQKSDQDYTQEDHEAMYPVYVS